MRELLGKTTDLPGSRPAAPNMINQPVSLVMLATLAIQQVNDATAAERSKRLAVVLWLGLATLLVLVVGIALVLWVARRGRQIPRRRDPVHTDMPDIWFLNPPDKGRPKDR